jgi:hypothetical protein
MCERERAKRLVVEIVSVQSSVSEIKETTWSEL